VRLRAVPGRALHDRLADADLPGAAAAAGAALRALHDGPLPVGAPVRDARAEIAGLEHRAVALAAHAAPGSPARALAQRMLALAARVAGELRTGAAGRTVAVHGDLHDKQILVADDGTVGIIDFDTLTAGEAALDLANLVVHLELRALQGACTAGAAAAAGRALLDAYAPDAAMRARMPAYARATRLRLAWLYAFRPSRAGVVSGLLGVAAPPPRRPAPVGGSRPAAPAR
jgi:aminoglycoside phosphotransferase (APT) family kinase protein